MSYQSIVEMSSSQSLQARLVAAAAEAGKIDPLPWVQSRVWQIVSTEEGWATAWDYARDSATLANNPDTGIRPDVISDAMIKTSVLAVMTEETAPQ